MRAAVTKIGFTAVVACLIAACGRSSDPQAVAESFWHALLAEDTAELRELATEDTEASLADLPAVDAAIEFGGVEFVDAEARVPVRVIYPDDGGVVLVDTWLVEEDGVWHVDAERTLMPLRTREAVADMVEEIRQLGRDLRADIGEAVEGLRQQVPALRESVRELGEQAAALRDELDRQLPALKSELDALVDAFEEAYGDRAAPPAGAGAGQEDGQEDGRTGSEAPAAEAPDRL